MPAVIIIIAAVAVFVIMMILLPRLVADRSSKYAQKTLDRISRSGGPTIQSQGFRAAAPEQMELLRNNYDETVSEKVGAALSRVPVFGTTYAKLKKSGMKIGYIPYLFCFLGFTALLCLFLTNMSLGPFIGGLGGIILGIFINNTFLDNRINNRNEDLLKNFPDAIDMIVRSVKSGHPLLSSFKMIAENAEPPIRGEFKQMVEEISYGRPMQEALKKMADRIGILDINFFVVILSVQQDTGGNLAEVLSNLSGIIRKRKQLRLKIRALTSEGRVVGWIFAGIPVFQLGAIKLASPNYLDAYSTDQGKFWMLVAIGLICSAIYVTRRMCNFEI